MAGGGAVPIFRFSISATPPHKSQELLSLIEKQETHMKRPIGFGGHHIKRFSSVAVCNNNGMVGKRFIFAHAALLVKGSGLDGAKPLKKYHVVLHNKCQWSD